jgi:hypothetical protein
MKIPKIPGNLHLPQNLPHPNFRRLFNQLKLLPAITFALMLGAGMVVSAFAAWYTVIIGYGKWPETVAEARIQALGLGLAISLGLIGLVIVALAFGKVKQLGITAPNGIGANLEFDDDDDNHVMSVSTTSDTTSFTSSIPPDATKVTTTIQTPDPTVTP